MLKWSKCIRSSWHIRNPCISLPKVTKGIRCSRAIEICWWLVDLVVALLLGLPVNADENLRETSKKKWGITRRRLILHLPVSYWCSRNRVWSSFCFSSFSSWRAWSAEPRRSLPPARVADSPYTYSHSSREKIETDQSAASVFIHSHSNWSVDYTNTIEPVCCSRHQKKSGFPY